jgi:hypothetical protein
MFIFSKSLIIPFVITSIGEFIHTYYTNEALGFVSVQSAELITSLEWNARDALTRKKLRALKR